VRDRTSTTAPTAAVIANCVALDEKITLVSGKDSAPTPQVMTTLVASDVCPR
jgi:hypothetical protein